MKIDRVHIGLRVLWVLMALHILNFSIDNPHTLFESNKVDTDFEEVDSMVELVLEDVFNIENAIPEHHTKTPLTHKFNIKKVVWMFDQQEYLKFNEPVAENFKIVQSNLFYSNPIYNSPLVSDFFPPPEQV
ncbi:hypothetical protein [Flavobacterium sp. NRK1]|uniref:hypothetical protein n=1 Tax=Flavobacterium sp. NRK1 TaxID=2954929 RepID=UPI002093E9DD|nr:hypothetical protein [Flavobacterium sp. NRK1]MCO6149171.1 hypothetical protein [Flavobacterium sp. NRK1]